MPGPAESASIDLEIDIHASVWDVWHALVTDKRRAWWSYLELDPRPGGRLIERWQDETGRSIITEGEILGIDAPHRLRCTWRDEEWPAATELEFELRQEGDRTRVRLHHVGWEHLGDEGPPLRLAHLGGWKMHLADLKSFVEAGKSG
jgi:uncharacterized protein YndB with AHSA1/START domain